MHIVFPVVELEQKLTGDKRIAQYVNLFTVAYTLQQINY